MLKKTHLRIEPKDNRIEVKLHFLPNRNDVVYYNKKRYLVETTVFDFDENAIDIYCLIDE